MRKSSILPGKRCRSCKGRGCDVCAGHGFVIKPPKPRKPVKPLKDGRSKINREYTILRIQFLVEHPKCQVLGPSGRVCGAPATECHHRRGRGRYMLETDTWWPCCQSCHAKIHGPLQAWSRRMGYLVNFASTQETTQPSATFLPYEA